MGNNFGFFKRLSNYNFTTKAIVSTRIWFVVLTVSSGKNILKPFKIFEKQNQRIKSKCNNNWNKGTIQFWEYLDSLLSKNIDRYWFRSRKCLWWMKDNFLESVTSKNKPNLNKAKMWVRLYQYVSERHDYVLREDDCVHNICVSLHIYIYNWLIYIYIRKEKWGSGRKGGTRKHWRHTRNKMRDCYFFFLFRGRGERGGVGFEDRNL